MASNVGSAFLAIFPVFNGFRKAVDKEVQGATGTAGKTFNQGFTKAAQQSGASAGKGFTQGFTTNSKDVGIASLKTLESQVRSTTQANSRARLAEQDAIGKVNIAQAAYNATIGKYAAGSVQSVKATEGLASAQRKAVAAGETVKSTFSSMTTAQANLKTATENASNSVQKQSSVFSGLGSRLGAGITDGFGNAMSVVTGLVTSGLQIIAGIAVAGAATVGVTIGAALTAGFSRLATIEVAQAKLKALGNTSADVAEIMKNANDAVIGTQYSLADAATIAASAVAAGVKPGADLSKYLRLVANTAALTGDDLSNVGTALNNVQTTGAAYNDTLQILAQKGLPVYTLLSKTLGITTADVKDLASQGKISAQQFNDALTAGVGDAAVAVGHTTVGSFENMKAAFTRFGAALLAPAFPAFAKTFTAIQGALDRLGKALAPIIEKYAPKLASAFQPFIDAILPAFNQLVDKFTTWINSTAGQEFLAQLGANFKLIGAELVKSLPSLIHFVESMGKLVADGLLFASAVAPSMIDSFAGIAEGAGKVGDNLDTAFQKMQDGTFWDTVVAKFANGWDQILEGFTNGGAQIGAFFSTFFINLGPGLANGWNQILMGFGNGWNQITAGTGVWLAGLGAQFANGWNQIVAGFSNGWNQIMAAFGNGATQIGAMFANGLAQILGAFANGWSQVVGGFANGWQQIIAGFSNGAAQISAFFGGLAGRIASAIGDLQARFYTIGAQIVQGIISGVTDWAGKAAASVARVAGDMLNAAKNALGIRSPSKVFRDQVGAQIGAGVVEGVNSTKGAVSASVSRLVSIPTTAAPRIGSSGSATGAGSGNVYVDKIVAPDQNPVVSGRIMGREFLRKMAGVAA